MKLNEFWTQQNNQTKKNLTGMQLTLRLSKFVNSNLDLFIPSTMNNLRKDPLYIHDPKFERHLSRLKRINPDREVENVRLDVTMKSKIKVLFLDFDFDHSSSTPTIQLRGHLPFTIDRQYNYKGTNREFYFSSENISLYVYFKANVFDHELLEEMYLDYMTQ
jgi:hypothetical protein